MAILRVIDFDKEKSFECQGRKFYLKESLSFIRYRELQKLNLEFGYSATFHDIFKQIRLAWDFLNSTKLGEAAVVLHNIMYGVVALDDKEDPALRMCALFIDEDSEDPTVYDEAKMKEKIECWGKELDVTPFFQLAANLSRRFPKWFTESRNGKRRVTAIVNEMVELDKYWNELLYSITKGVPSEMRELKRFDIFDFFDYIDNKNKTTI